MKRITLRILLASLACLVGVGSTAAWHYLRHRPLSLCEIASNPERFDGRFLRVRGALYGSSGGVLLLGDSGCSVESDAWAEVSLPPSGKYQALSDELRRLSAGDDFGKVGVVITGEFVDRHKSCFAARYAISTDEVEQLTPVSVVNYFEEMNRAR